MREKNGEHPLGDTGQLILLGIFLVVWVGDSFLLHGSTFLARVIPGSLRIASWLVLLIISLYLLRSGHKVIPHPSRPAAIKTDGAFRLVRHPLYLASLLTYLSLAFLTCSLFSLFLLPGIFYFYNYIAGYEEKIMLEKYGEEYRHYLDRTGKWFPRVNKKNRGPR